MDQPETAQVLATGSGSGTSAGSASSTHAAPSRIEAAVVLPVPSSGHASVYGMFDATDVTAEGATLRGGLLLEVNEEVTIELRLADLTRLRALARVVEILHGKPPAMKVVWIRVAEADRHHLGR
jgi:hypothetical protein